MLTLITLMTLAQAADVAALAWLSGCWRQESPSRVVEEMWMTPSGDGMLGMSRTVARGRIVDQRMEGACDRCEVNQSGREYDRVFATVVIS